MSVVEETTSQPRRRIGRQTVAKQFVRLFYGVLNTHPEFLFQFYGKNSTVTVSETLEEGQTYMETAEDEASVKELLKSIYADVTVRIESAVPQFSVDDTVLLHINGIMYRKTSDSHRAFTQVFVLCPQANGYYIRTDVAHVLGYYHPSPLLEHWTDRRSSPSDPWADVHRGSGGARAQGASSVASSEQGAVLRLGTYQGAGVDDINAASHNREIRTATPPLEDAPRTSTKSQGSDHDSDDFPTEHPSKRMTKPWIVRPQSANTSVCHTMMSPPMVMHTMPAAMPMPAMHMGHPPVAYPMPMPAPAAAAPARYMRQRSMSMGCDPWTNMQAASGHGVFIARLPFGAQPADVEEAFSVFGPIQGGRDGIQVRDGRNGCYAFVTFEKQKSAQAAIQQGAVLQGKRVFVEPRYPRQEAAAAEAHLMAFPALMGASPPMAPYHIPPPPPPPSHIPRMPR